MDAYDLGIKQRPCPAAAVNTTDWFFAIAYETNHPSNAEESHASEYFRNAGNMTSVSYDLRASQLQTVPKLFNQYGYTITRSNFSYSSAVPLGGIGFRLYAGSVQMSGWVSLPAAGTGIINFGYRGPEISLTYVSSGLASLRARQSWNDINPQMVTIYDVSSANFACPTDGTWFYLTLVVNGSTGVITAYVGTTLVATLNTRANLFNILDANYGVGGNKRDFIMRKWTTGDTIIVPTRLLQLA